MSGTQIQSATAPERGAVTAYQDGPQLEEWGGGTDAPPPVTGPKFGRYIAALKRYKWLIALFAVVGAGGGYGATKILTPEYQVKSTILLEVAAGSSGSPNAKGPVQGQELLRAAGWTDLMRSFSIADPVVMQLALFVEPVKPADSTIFRAFRVDQQRLRPGDYLLTLAGNRYVLSLKPGAQVEQGALGDSIGRDVGFLWQPNSGLFGGRKEIEFRVQTPREASLELIKKMTTLLATGSSLMFVTLNGENSARTAATLNAWVEQFVTKATALKKKNVMSYATILEGQRQYSADNLTAAEGALQRFRVNTVTEPNERQIVMPGLEMTSSSVFNDYFKDKVLAEGFTRDRVAIERILEQGKKDGVITPEAVLSVPIVVQDPASEPLRKLLIEQTQRETDLRKLQETFLDEAPQVKSQKTFLNDLRTVNVPRALAAYLAQLKIKESQLKARIDVSSKDLRSIPTRTIQEQQLKRQVDVASDLYRSLDLKAAEAKLAEAATIPDVSVLDSAVAPLEPTKNTAPVIIAGAIAFSLVLSAMLAILLDGVDKRFRYPEQATEDLGLFVLGVVPIIDAKAGRKRSADQAAQVVEAFRSIRMNVRYAADPNRPLTMTITSPGPNDGKSLVSSNLALSFAEAGARTLLIDGDLRRGELAKTFGLTKKPGLVEYLDGTALIAEVLQPVQSHANLTVIQAGARRRRAPELLATPRLSQLINQMASEFEVVIVDSPPLGAGFDAFALATATGNMALVLRSGMTDRKMAAAKMAVVDTLPVRVMGAILNGIKLDGVYQYYSYYQGYAAEDEEQDLQITDGGKGQVSAVVTRG